MNTCPLCGETYVQPHLMRAVRLANGTRRYVCIFCILVLDPHVEECRTIQRQLEQGKPLFAVTRSVIIEGDGGSYRS